MSRPAPLHVEPRAEGREQKSWAAVSGARGPGCRPAARPEGLLDEAAAGEAVSGPRGGRPRPAVLVPTRRRAAPSTSGANSSAGASTSAPSARRWASVVCHSGTCPSWTSGVAACRKRVAPVRGLRHQPRRQASSVTRWKRRQPGSRRRCAERAVAAGTSAGARTGGRRHPRGPAVRWRAGRAVGCRGTGQHGLRRRLSTTPDAAAPGRRSGARRRRRPPPLPVPSAQVPAAVDGAQVRVGDPQAGARGAPRAVLRPRGDRRSDRRHLEDEHRLVAELARLRPRAL